MKKLLCTAALLLAFAVPASAKTILFIGNSFTFGANSAAHYYKPETVTDLNGPHRQWQDGRRRARDLQGVHETGRPGLHGQCRNGGRQGHGLSLCRKNAP